VTFVVEHYETVRQRKHGSRVDISLRVSPLRNVEGKVVGASKIARDITSASVARSACARPRRGCRRSASVGPKARLQRC
jgi:hypothetical protein